MCLGTQSKSASTSVPQSLNLGSGYALEIGDAANLQTANFYMPSPPAPSALQSITSSAALPYAAIIAAGYIAYRALN